MKIPVLLLAAFVAGTAFGAVAFGSWVAVQRRAAPAPQPLKVAVTELAELSEPQSDGHSALGAILGKSASVVDELSHYQSFLGILRDQLGNVGAETEGAALSILTRLNEIDRRIRAIIDFVEPSGSDDDVSELMLRSEARMEESRRLLDEFRHNRDQAAAESKVRLDEILAMVAGLNRIITQVRNVARQTNMLSINAAIEAAQAGEAGKGFRVVAGEVKQLSLLSDQAAADIGEGIAKLQGVIRSNMEIMLLRRLEAEKAGFEQLSDSVAAMTGNFDRLIGHQRDVMTKVHSESEMIAEPIMQLIGSIQFQDVTRQQLQHVSQSMEMIGRHSQQLGLILRDYEAEHDLESIQSGIASSLQGYVMSQQRNIHNQSMGDVADEDKGPLVELF